MSVGAAAILNSCTALVCVGRRFFVVPSRELVIDTASLGETGTAIPTTVAVAGTATVYT